MTCEMINFRTEEKKKKEDLYTIDEVDEDTIKVICSIEKDALFKDNIFVEDGWLEALLKNPDVNRGLNIKIKKCFLQENGEFNFGTGNKKVENEINNDILSLLGYELSEKRICERLRNEEVMFDIEGDWYYPFKL